MNQLVPRLQLKGWDAETLRGQAVELLETTASADVFFFSLSRSDHGLHYSNTIFTSGIRWHLGQFEGLQAFDDSLVNKAAVREWSVREPEPQMHNRFSTLEEDYDDIRPVFELETFRRAFAPIELSDQARALFYDGDRFLASMSAMRRGGERFRPSMLDRIRKQTRTIHRLLLLADRVARPGMEGPLHLVADENGRIVYADERAGSWMTDRRAEALRRLLRDQRIATVDGMVPTYGWLDDGHRKLRHVVLSPSRAVSTTRWQHLSRTQREIVRLAFDGLSNTEIARLQGISTSTVKYHLTQAATALDVSGRQGLLDALGEEDWPVG